MTPVAYTNRKGFTYFLCQGMTKAGRPRYHFTRTPCDAPVEHIPSGFRISESVNGIVSLVKVRQSQILPDEFQIVQAALDRHPKGRYYRTNVRTDRIEVYEPVGPTPEELTQELAKMGIDRPDLSDVVHAEMDRHMQFTPVMRFILKDEATRQYRVERMVIRGGFEGWHDIHRLGPLEQLVRELIPTLGTDAFFEL